MKDLRKMAEEILHEERVRLQVGVRITDAVPKEAAIQAVIRAYQKGLKERKHDRP